MKKLTPFRVIVFTAVIGGSSIYDWSIHIKLLEQNISSENSTTQVQTVEELQALFDARGYSIASVTENGLVPRIFVKHLPNDIKDIRDAQERKSVFIKTLLPGILLVNEQIKADRSEIKNLASKPRISKNENVWLEAISKKYGLETIDFKLLMQRVDTVPVSLALAQAAIESGWGTSRFAHQGNALFGQWTYDASEGISPKDRDAGKTHVVKSFDKITDSIRAYIINLNTHDAYLRFRELREQMRNQRRSPSSSRLASALSHYSEHGIDYVKLVRNVIEMNSLHVLDNAKLEYKMEEASVQ